MDKRHEFHLQQGPDDWTEEYMTFHFPGLGNINLTYESNDWYEGKRPVISFDFDPKKIRLIDGRGNDREIQ